MGWFGFMLVFTILNIKLSFIEKLIAAISDYVKLDKDKSKAD